MTRFSANLGFLFADRPLPDAIRAAHAAGFDAVECHWPYDTPADAVAAALHDTGLPMLGLNTRRGDVAAGDNGLAAIPGREAEAKDAIDEAIAYAARIGAGAVHVMAGFADGPEARACFMENLSYACRKAAARDLTILIEPLNRFDAPGYFLKTTGQAADLIEALALPNLALMFDCYHVGRTEGDVIARLRALYSVIGHIQFAAVPDRGTPDHGEVDYRLVFEAIADLAWPHPLGAEYKPTGRTEASLAWMTDLA